MLNTEQFVSKEINSIIPVCLQDLLWCMVDTLSDDARDTLQVFELSSIVIDGIQHQLIRLEQEKPQYTEEIMVISDEPVSARIFIVSDTLTSTMYLSSEHMIKT